jgi:hypothetical protein
MSQDPMGFDAGDSNLYRYCNNQPTNATDPTGLDETQYRDISKNTQAVYDENLKWVKEQAKIAMEKRWADYWQWELNNSPVMKSISEQVKILESPVPPGIPGVNWNQKRIPDSSAILNTKFTIPVYFGNMKYHLKLETYRGPQTGKFDYNCFMLCLGGQNVTVPTGLKDAAQNPISAPLVIQPSSMKDFLSKGEKAGYWHRVDPKKERIQTGDLIIFELTQNKLGRLAGELMHGAVVRRPSQTTTANGNVVDDATTFWSKTGPDLRPYLPNTTLAEMKKVPQTPNGGLLLGDPAIQIQYWRYEPPKKK